MRKAIVILLLLIGIACCFTPCCLTDDCAAEQGLTTTDEHGNEEGNAGSCSSFAACATCNGFVKLTEPPALQVPFGNVNASFIPLYTETLSDYHNPFWQPPRS